MGISSSFLPQRAGFPGKHRGRGAGTSLQPGEPGCAPRRGGVPPWGGTEGGPGGGTNVLAYSIYESAFVSNRWGYASAMSIVFFIILLAISILQFRAEKKGVFYQ